MHHFGQLPWSNIAISGHALAVEGTKISKSRGGGPADPVDVMDRYSADALRYWSASTKLGRDTVISEEKFAVGKRLVTKLWNVGRFTLHFLEGYEPRTLRPPLTLTDSWLLSQLQWVIEKATQGFKDYDYVVAKDEVESFFWNTLADTYLEMVRVRLYELGDEDSRKQSAEYMLCHVLLCTIKLFAPIMPYATDRIFRLYFSQREGVPSVHISTWPQPSSELISEPAEAAGAALLEIAGLVRGYKSSRKLPLRTELKRLVVSSPDEHLLSQLQASALDLRSVSRARGIAFRRIITLEAQEISLHIDE